MTEKDADRIEDDSPEENSGVEGAANPSSSEPESSAHTDAAVPTPPDGGEELPEYEELTPEIVEEEAIRGDFMLRWASIFLAILFGFSQIADTRTLVHVRSGDALQKSGFVPSGTDTLTYSLEGETSPNVSWLFDHVVSFAYSIGGENGLTLFKALVAGVIAYVLSLISVSGMPTWWSSICCVLAICAASIDFMPITDLATLLGLVLVLHLLHCHHEGRVTGVVWKLPVLIAVWTNLDSRAYIGVFVILLFTVGLKLRKSLAEKAGNATGADTGALWKAAVISVLALALNPAPAASLLSVVSTYSTEYTTMAAMNPLTGSAAFIDGSTEYFPIWNPGVFRGFEFAYLLGISVVAVAFVVLLISRDREDLPWLFTLSGLTLLACITVREMPLAALVAAAAAGTAAQRWYARTFRQDYTTETMEVLFSRGGRAVTVLAMAFLGFCAVADRLPTRTAVGLGFDPDLKTTIDTMGTQLAELPEDTRIFPTKISQGDLLIWHGARTFIDSRVSMFGSYSDDTSVVKRFDRLRRSFLIASSTETDDVEAAGPSVDEPQPDSATDSSNSTVVIASADWQPEYKELGIDRVMLRLCPPGKPAYEMTADFLNSGTWALTNRGPSAAFFQLTTPSKSDFNASKPAFGETVDKDVERFDFARAKDFYQKYLYKQRQTASAPLRDAQHYYALDSRFPVEATYQYASALGQDPNNRDLMEFLGRIVAGPLMTIRRANEALALEPQNAAAHRLLGMGYEQLNLAETAIAAPFNADGLNSIRYLQTVMALRQATTIDPEFPETWDRLRKLYEGNQKSGLALECLNKYLALVEDRLMEDPEADEFLLSMYEARTAWEERRAGVEDQLGQLLQQEEPEDPSQQAIRKFQIVQQLYSQGHTLVAMELADANIDILAGIPQAELLRGEMLLETGQLEDGYSVLTRLSAVARESKDDPQFASLPWHNMVALCNMAKGAYPAAVEAWSEQLAMLRDVENTTAVLIQPLLRSLPLVPDVEGKTSGGFGKWPVMHLEAARTPMDAVPRGRAEKMMDTAMAYLESGNLANARFALQELVLESGDHRHGILAEVYFSQLVDDASDQIAAARMNPWEDFEFPEVDDTSSDEPPTQSESEPAESPESSEPQ